MSGKTEVVKPLTEVAIKDVSHSKQKIDSWLQSHTHQDRKSTRLNSSHRVSRMPSSA